MFNITTSYAGEVHGRILTQLLADSSMVSGGHVYVKGGIIDKYHIPQMDLSNVIQKVKAELDIQTDPVGEATFKEQTLEPEELMVFLKYNPRDFESYWRQYQPEGRLLFKSLPAEIQSLLVQKIMNQVGYQMNYLLLNGDKADSVSTNEGMKVDFFDGFLTRIKANVTTGQKTAIAIPGTGASTGADTSLSASPITQATVLDALQTVKEAIFANKFTRIKYAKPGFKYFASPLTVELWKQYQRDALYKGVDLTQSGVALFDGKPLVAMESFPENAVMATVATSDERSNLWAGTNDKRDDESITSDRTAPYNETYFMKMLFNMGTAIPYSNEVVYYDSELTIS